MTRPHDPQRERTHRGDADPVQSQLHDIKQQQARLFADMARGQQRFRRLARSVWRIQEDERRRFARDLHDGLGQHITAILHQLEQLADDPGLGGTAPLRVERAIDLCTRALHDTRTLARTLRPKILDDLGLCAALHWLGRSIAEGGALLVDIDCDEDFPDPSGDLATLVFRVAQEALTNVAKHANASHALVNVGARDGRLQLLVADDGVGFDPDNALADGDGGGSGLGSMRERVALFGGQLSLVSAPGDGTQLRAVLPLRGDPGEEAA
jgi:signal transduction histidine kinase